MQCPAPVMILVATRGRLLQVMRVAVRERVPEATKLNLRIDYKTPSDRRGFVLY